MQRFFAFQKRNCIFALPSSDIQFLKELANRMGWKTNTVNSETSKTELDKAILDVKQGNVKNFDKLEEMKNYLDA